MKKKPTSPERHNQLKPNFVCIVKRKFKQWWLTKNAITINKMSIYLSPLSLEKRRKRHMALKNRSLFGTDKTN
jgi:hypothetical protein